MICCIILFLAHARKTKAFQWFSKVFGNHAAALFILPHAREMLETDIIKLEVLGDERTLLPDPVDTLAATAILADEGFTVMVYTSDDVRLAKRLEEVGAAAVMPAGSPIGSGQGILNPLNIRLICEQAEVPVLVDAGVGGASDVAVAMELGADGVLLNSAVAGAADPLRMARAVKAACEAGRDSFLAGRIKVENHK